MLLLLSASSRMLRTCVAFESNERSTCSVKRWIVCFVLFCLLLWWLYPEEEYLSAWCIVIGVGGVVFLLCLFWGFFFAAADGAMALSKPRWIVRRGPPCVVDCRKAMKNLSLCRENNRLDSDRQVSQFPSGSLCDAMALVEALDTYTIYPPQYRYHIRATNDQWFLLCDELTWKVTILP